MTEWYITRVCVCVYIYSKVERCCNNISFAWEIDQCVLSGELCSFQGVSH